MQELEITWKRVRAVWWLILWRSFLLTIVILFGGGFVFVSLGGLLGLSQDFLGGIIAIAYFLVGPTCLAVAIQMALKKRYSDFRLALVLKSSDAKLG
jgi:hypothetical protein